MFTNYQSEEKHYEGKRDCDKCKHTFIVECVMWRDKEYWTCPMCKEEYESDI